MTSYARQLVNLSSELRALSDLDGQNIDPVSLANIVIMALDIIAAALDQLRDVS